MLVEEFLVAVVSLPAGVFNPYSGVKTSILILDKVLAKKTDHIAFFKVENDGFDLGAQRREIDKNDLPQVAEELCEYLARFRAGEAVDDSQYTPMAAEPGAQYTTDEPITHGLIVEKSKVAEDGEYSLSGERYRKTVNYANMKWPMVELGSIIRILNGYAFKSKNYVTDGIRVIRITNVQRGRIVDNDPKFYPKSSEKSISKYMLNENDLLLSLTGNVGRIGILNASYLPAALNQRVACLRPDNDKALAEYIFYLLNQNSFEDDCIKAAKGLAQKNLSTVWLSKYRIPLPPLEVQREIVSEIEGYQRIIDGARAVVENYQPQIAVDPEWPMVELEEVCNSILSGGTPSTKNKDYWNGDIPWITSADIVNIKTAEPRKYITDRAIRESATNLIPAGNVIVVTRVGLGKLFKNEFDVCISQDSQGLIIKDGINADYLAYILRDGVANFKNISQGSTIQGVTKRQLTELLIPFPTLETQQAIVAEIEAEQALVDANRKLVERFEKKIQDTVGRVWGEDSA